MLNVYMYIRLTTFWYPKWDAKQKVYILDSFQAIFTLHPQQKIVGNGSFMGLYLCTKKLLALRVSPKQGGTVGEISDRPICISRLFYSGKNF